MPSSQLNMPSRDLTLHSPSEAFRDSYRSLVAEFVERGEPLVPFSLAVPNEDFSAFLAQLAGYARGEGIPAGFVPHSTFWLVSAGREVVGVSNIRHRLTSQLRREGGNIGFGVRPSARGCGVAKELLRQTLLRARALGLSQVLLTCAQDNAASVRTIVHNGGTLDSEELLPERGEMVQRYWIDLTRTQDSATPLGAG